VSGLSGLLATPFSDLWLPTVLIGLAIIALLLLHWLWLSWRVQRLNKRLRAQAQPSLASDTVPTGMGLGVTSALAADAATGSTHVLSDLNAFTAQRNPVALEEKTVEVPRYEPTVISPALDERIDPSFEVPPLGAALNVGRLPVEQANFAVNPAEAGSPSHAASELPASSMGDEAPVFFNPHTTLLQNKAPQAQTPTAHEVFHFQARFSWGDAQGEALLKQALQTNPWTHALPVSWCGDASNALSVVAAWQIVNRRELAQPQDAEFFKRWCATVANASGAQLDFLSPMEWEGFLDRAHALLIDLDSVIVLKVGVPLVQLDLFTQSLLAARFVQNQEHWVFQEHAHSGAICLERLWLKANASDAANNQQAVFQLIIDIPHLDSLEARKVYMRLRAVSRASAAIIQSTQGTHLSEGMLDRYSRELMMKQDALSQAKVVPGSALAISLFKPQLRLNADLEG
jgi:hypothetical protein